MSLIGVLHASSNEEGQGLYGTGLDSLEMCILTPSLTLSLKELFQILWVINIINICHHLQRLVTNYCRLMLKKLLVSNVSYWYVLFLFKNYHWLMFYFF